MILLNKFINFIGQDYMYGQYNDFNTMKNYNTIILRGYKSYYKETVYMYLNKKIWIDSAGIWKIVGKTLLTINNRCFSKYYNLYGDLSQYDDLYIIDALRPFYSNYKPNFISIRLYMKEAPL